MISVIINCAQQERSTTQVRQKYKLQTLGYAARKTAASEATRCELKHECDPRSLYLPEAGASEQECVFSRAVWLFQGESPSGRRKALATSSINMKQYASPMPTQTDVKLKFKPLSKKVVSATLQFSLSCIFLREGKATDEDMQSLASLMSMKQADIGNLDDFEEENEEDEENRVNQEEKAAKITEIVNQLNALSCLHGDDDDDDGVLKRARKATAKPAASSQADLHPGSMRLGYGEDDEDKLDSSQPFWLGSPWQLYTAFTVSHKLISKLNFLEDEDQDALPTMCTNPFDDPDDDLLPNHLNPFGDPDEDEPPAQPVSRQRVDDDSFYDHDSSNPFNEPDEPGTQTPPGNPFDDPEQDADVQPDPEPPKPRQRKGVRPVDMSKYLYADTTPNEDEELDESNPFYEPRTSSPTRPPAGGPSLDVVSSQKRRAPLPPSSSPGLGPSPMAPKPSAVPDRERAQPIGPSPVAAVMGRELASSSPKSLFIYQRKTRRRKKSEEIPADDFKGRSLKHHNKQQIHTAALHGYAFGAE
ncbi:EH domain-binding protein 1 [Collichthys lucidus]|uniref:EH domain-binding protein 1 n=1 Tax=Collichthys lucidus TaxID=240159 RepID=A0A4U5VGC5_COLLU|nr:EH domain-binding protein 1 [Collichthys lucidus]